MLQYTKLGVEALEIMLKRNIKMKDVAQEIGVSVSYISKIFKGVRYGERQRPLIAKMLGMKSEVEHS